MPQRCFSISCSRPRLKLDTMLVECPKIPAPGRWFAFGPLSKKNGFSGGNSERTSKREGAKEGGRRKRESSLLLRQRLQFAQCGQPGKRGRTTGSESAAKGEGAQEFAHAPGRKLLALPMSQDPRTDPQSPSAHLIPTRAFRSLARAWAQ